jgi:hypothetical protein
MRMQMDKDRKRVVCRKDAAVIPWWRREGRNCAATVKENYRTVKSPWKINMQSKDREGLQAPISLSAASGKRKDIQKVKYQ